MTPHIAGTGEDKAGAFARLRHHERLELRALQLAVDARHDTIARLFEARADQAHLDADAIAAEHHLPVLRC
jgi:hypothetical protein